MPPTNLPTQDTNTDNNSSSLNQNKKSTDSVIDETSPLTQEVAGELERMEEKTGGLENLGNRISKNQFDAFAKQREIKQSPQAPVQDNRPSRVQELIRSKYSDYPIKPLRTYRGDVEEAIQNKNASVTSIAIAEKKRKETRGEKTSTKKRVGPQNTLIIILILVLVIAGTGSLFIFLYAKYEQSKAVITLYKQTIVPSDTGTQITFVPDSIIQNRLSIRENILSTEAKIGSVVYFDLIKNMGGEKLAPASVPVSELVSVIAPSIPSYLERSFEKDYMLGLYVLSGNEPFLIIKTNSYETAFSGMLAWEETLLSDATSVFFASDQVFATTTKATIFEDKIVKNKDTRIAKNINGETVLLYSFLDKKTLIITTKESVFSEILGRYLNSKLVR